MNVTEEEAHITHWLELVRTPTTFWMAVESAIDYFDKALVTFLAFDHVMDTPVVVHSFGCATMPTGKYHVTAIGDFFNDIATPEVATFNKDKVFVMAGFGLLALNTIPDNLGPKAHLVPQGGKNPCHGFSMRLLPLSSQMATILLHLIDVQSP